MDFAGVEIISMTNIRRSKAILALIIDTVRKGFNMTINIPCILFQKLTLDKPWNKTLADVLAVVIYLFYGVITLCHNSVSTQIEIYQVLTNTYVSIFELMLPSSNGMNDFQYWR